MFNVQSSNRLGTLKVVDFPLVVLVLHMKSAKKAVASCWLSFHESAHLHFGLRYGPACSRNVPFLKYFKSFSQTVDPLVLAELFLPLTLTLLQLK